MSDNVSQAEIYRAIKNVIHNDLGITKDYIDKVIQDTVKTEIAKLMKDECFIYGLVEKEVMRSLHNKDAGSWRTLHDASTFIKDEITSTILDEVKNRLEIKLKDNSDEENYNPDEWETIEDKKSGHYIVRHKIGRRND